MASTAIATAFFTRCSSLPLNSAMVPFIPTMPAPEQRPLTLPSTLSFRRRCFLHCRCDFRFEPFRLRLPQFPHQLAKGHAGTAPALLRLTFFPPAFMRSNRDTSADLPRIEYVRQSPSLTSPSAPRNQHPVATQPRAKRGASPPISVAQPSPTCLSSQANRPLPTIVWPLPR